MWRNAGGGPTTYYLDLGSKLLDPTSSAEAVRELLDQALAARSAECTLTTAAASG